MKLISYEESIHLSEVLSCLRCKGRECLEWSTKEIIGGDERVLYLDFDYICISLIVIYLSKPLNYKIKIDFVHELHLSKVA